MVTELQTADTVTLCLTHLLSDRLMITEYVAFLSVHFHCILYKLLQYTFIYGKILKPNLLKVLKSFHVTPIICVIRLLSRNDHANEK